MLKPFFFYLIHALSIITLISVLGCSHKQPYFRIDDTQSDRVSIKLKDIKQRVYLVGDTGEPTVDDAVQRTMQTWTTEEKIPEKTTIIFLGDNIYPYGLPSEPRSKARKAEVVLRSQLKLVEKSGSPLAIFIPGNHDWGGREGPDMQTLKNQQVMLQNAIPGHNETVPLTGCPGPKAIDREGVRIIVMDTQWWLIPAANQEHCHFSNKDEVLDELKNMVDNAGEREVIIAAHHPLSTHGRHGGFFDWQDHVFPLTAWKEWLYVPLPIVGSTYPLGRLYIWRTDQDLVGEENKKMRAGFVRSLKDTPPLIYASGHDHSLQVIRGVKGAEYLLVSGAGSEGKLTPVGHGEETLFAHEHTGFMVVDFLDNGSVLLRVVEPETNGVEQQSGKVVYTKRLKKPRPLAQR